MSVDPNLHYDKQRVEVEGLTMAYIEAGSGSPIVLLHGNPTSSYLWRNIIPHLEPLGRCIAPDLVGHGDSDKRQGEGDDRYRFVEHRRYLDAFLAAVDATDDVTLVIHDWGSALGFDWANRHREAVHAIAFMEAICGPVSLEDWPENSRGIFAAMRSDDGETICLEKNVFVERILPSSVIRDLSDAEMDEYRRPFTEPGEPRRPTLTWPRELPFDGQPQDVAEVVSNYAEWLATSEVPKLYLHADPGFLSNVFAERVRSWPNLTERQISGIHFVQEDEPDRIGRAIADWLATTR
ncbi:MAG: haloalkane dehalogenase [Nitriliruptorales bacterium]|nr:haloalkane dehalogenase [Nitriliruptorales bacterium]